MIIRVIHPIATARAVVEFFRLVARHREVVVAMAQRDLGSRFAGQMLGAFWALLHPLIFISVYTFVFAVVFKARMPEGTVGPSYTIYLLSGLVPWMAFQEAIIRSATSVSENANLVKQVIFPVEILPVKSVVAAMATPLIAFAAMLVIVLFETGGLPLMALLLPLLLVMQMAAMVGIAMLLGAVGVYFRDLKDLVQVGCFVAIYGTPIFYMAEWVPPALRPLIYLNPFSYVVWCYRDAIYYGRFETPWAWVVFAGLTILSFALGYRVFRRLKPGFGSVL